MKKTLTAALATATALTANAQLKGNFQVDDFATFKLHTYTTNDAIGDASYIIEGPNALVTLEEPLFKDNVAEFNDYLAKLAKPVSARIADYHIGGTADAPIVMAEGMSQFVGEGAYAAMMQGFAQAFGDAIVDLPTGKATEVKFGKTKKWADVEFEFRHGAASDFPAASLLIGNKVYITHWAPAKAHMNA